MVHMAGTIQLAGKTKFSFSKLLTGGEMHESSYTGRGKVMLAPTLFGDIFTLQIDGRAQWRIGKDSYLASTGEVIKENKMQGLSKALFSGEDLFVYNVYGNGLMWLKSFGAVDRITVSPVSLFLYLLETQVGLGIADFCDTAATRRAACGR